MERAIRIGNHLIRVGQVTHATFGLDHPGLTEVVRHLAVYFQGGASVKLYGKEIPAFLEIFAPGEVPPETASPALCWARRYTSASRYWGWAPGSWRRAMWPWSARARIRRSVVSSTRAASVAPTQTSRFGGSVSDMGPTSW
jgi:hypothetical protein